MRYLQFYLFWQFHFVLCKLYFVPFRARPQVLVLRRLNLELFDRCRGEGWCAFGKLPRPVWMLIFPIPICLFWCSAVTKVGERRMFCLLHCFSLAFENFGCGFCLALVLLMLPNRLLLILAPILSAFSFGVSWAVGAVLISSCLLCNWSSFPNIRTSHVALLFNPNHRLSALARNPKAHTSSPSSLSDPFAVVSLISLLFC